MKVLLVGPYPPPHGGVSVHLRNVHETLVRAGIRCSVLNIAKGASGSPAYIRTTGALDFCAQLLRHAIDEWTFHVHTNGHNRKSWLVALACGLTAQMGSGGVLTLHSGLLCDYLNSGAHWKRDLARLVCLLYNRVVCVNQEIARTLEAIGVPVQQLEVLPAFLPTTARPVSIPADIENWMAKRETILATTLSFRPEYGFDVLVAALLQLQRKRPRLGCLVMGSGEDRSEAEDLVRRVGLADTIFMAGDLDHDLCLNLMSRSDLFVRSTFRDGDAISVREALALGVPVVASNVGARPSGVLLFTPGDADELALRMEQGLDCRSEWTAPECAPNGAGRLMALYSF